MIYVLDALDSYNKRLVKKIEVKGFVVSEIDPFTSLAGLPELEKQ